MALLERDEKKRTGSILAFNVFLHLVNTLCLDFRQYVIITVKNGFSLFKDSAKGNQYLGWVYANLMLHKS